MSERKILPCPDEGEDPSGKAKVDEYHIRLITPLFGGGAVAGVNDVEMPIRATAIRGQLQFWWRATRGAVYPTLAAMRERHREVWGATDKASPVTVEVADVRASDPVPCGRYEQGSPRLTWLPPFAGKDNALPYVLFPFQGKNTGPAHERKDPARCIHEASFTLRLRYPEALKCDVGSAMWAWVNFGGLGARTRRGCGALRCDRLAPANVIGLEGWYRKHVVVSTTVREWPTMPASMFVNPEPGEPVRVWAWVVGLMRHFRQGEGFSRNPGQQPNRPGRSRFPEPETIRETMRADRRQSGHQRLPSIPADAFPRAEFGLPIIYELRGTGEPPKVSLQPIVGGKPGQRMGSPLILKPLALANGQAAPLLLRLDAPPVDDVVLMQGEREQRRFGGNAVRSPRLAAYPNSPLAGSPNGSALEAFLEFARSEGFV